MPEDMPDRMPEDMPDRIQEDMSDRMPEDLPVTKCINAMVGITRSKVILHDFMRLNIMKRLGMKPNMLIDRQMRTRRRKGTDFSDAADVLWLKLEALLVVISSFSILGVQFIMAKKTAIGIDLGTTYSSLAEMGLYNWDCAAECSKLCSSL